jgi:hypothetical protein
MEIAALLATSAMSQPAAAVTLTLALEVAGGQTNVANPARLTIAPGICTAL